MSACCDCHAEVIFVPSAKTGRPMILDAEPKKGVILGYRDGLGEVWGVDRNDGELARVVDVFTDHHAACPAAAAWKGKTRKAPPAQHPDGGRRGH